MRGLLARVVEDVYIPARLVCSRCQQDFQTVQPSLPLTSSIRDVEPLRLLSKSIHHLDLLGGKLNFLEVFCDARRSDGFRDDAVAADLRPCNATTHQHNVQPKHEER